MNCFGFRHVKAGGLFHAEYRLAHWARYRAVRDSEGEPAMFAHAMDASVAAANALVESLNGNAAFWSGAQGDEARQAAEKLFAKEVA